MKWKCPGYKVLLRLKDIDTFFEEQLKHQEFLQKSGFKIAVGDSFDHKRQQLAMDIGTIVQVGEMAWRNEALGYGKPGWKPWAKVGDEVIITKYCGKLMEMPDTKEMLYIVADVDIQLVKEAE